MPITWTLTAYELPLRYLWKIARNTSAAKTNLVVQVRQAGTTGRGEAAPNVRYGESPELLQAQFDGLLRHNLASIDTLSDLATLLAAHPVAYALRFALESALTHYLAARAAQPVWLWLGVPEPRRQVATAFSLPIMEAGEVAGFLQREHTDRFKLLKVKVNKEQGADLLRAVALACPGQPLLVDGNEAWPDADSLLRFLEGIAAVPGLNMQLLEQPLPASCAADYRYLYSRVSVPLMADESVANDADFDEIARQFHGVNVKLMKAGGYQRGIELLRRTRAYGLRPMLGCMVETTLGIWSALQVSALADVHDLDGSLILRSEPFGLVHEQAGQLTAAAPLG